MNIRKIIDLKGPDWPLCFARFCCCFGFHGSEVYGYRVLFWRRTKASEFFNITKMATKRSQRAVFNGQYCVLNCRGYDDMIDHRNYNHSPKADLGPVVRKVDNAIYQINHHLVDSLVCFVNTYPLDSDLSAG